MNKYTSSNVLYISFDGMTDTLGQSQVLPYLASLAKFGFKISLVSFEKPLRFAEQGDVVVDHCRSAGLAWYPLVFRKSVPLISSAYNLIRLFGKVIFLYRKHNFEIVHCRSFMSSIAGLAFKRLFGSRFIFDMRGFWVDERIEGGIIKNRYLYLVLKWIECQLIKGADICVVLTKAAIEDLKSWKSLSGVPAVKFTHITTCADLKSFYPVFKHNSKQVFDRSEINILYVGSVGPWHSFDAISKFLTHVDTFYRNVSVKLIIGQGKELIETFIKQNDLSPARFVVKTVPHYQIHDEFKDMDIGFFFIPRDCAKIASSPTKMGEMLAAGLPIITGTSIGDVESLVEDYRIGALIVHEDEDNFTRALDAVIRELEIDKIDLMKRCRKCAEDYFSLDDGVERYREIYDGLLNGQTA